MEVDFPVVFRMFPKWIISREKTRDAVRSDFVLQIVRRRRLALIPKKTVKHGSKMNVLNVFSIQHNMEK